MAVELGVCVSGRKLRTELVGLWYGLALNMKQDEKIKQSTAVGGCSSPTRLYQLLVHVLIFLNP